MSQLSSRISGGSGTLSYFSLNVNAFDPGHVLHYDCLIEWLSENKLCPACQKPLTKDIVSQQRINELMSTTEPNLVAIRNLLQ